MEGLWSSNPAPGVSLDDFSAEITGTLTFGAAGTYLMGLLAGDSEQVYINDQLLVQSAAPWTVAYGNYVATANQVVRIRIDFSHDTADAELSRSVCSRPCQGSSRRCDTSSDRPCHSRCRAGFGELVCAYSWWICHRLLAVRRSNCRCFRILNRVLGTCHRRI
jgi:hypothetical protein